MDENKIFTWDDIAAAIAKLPPEERCKQAKIQINDEGYFKKIAGLEVIQADIYEHIDNEDDCSDLETLKKCHPNDFDIKNYKLVTHKGLAFLYNDF